MRSAGFLKPSRIPLGACAAVRWIDLVLSVVCHACVRWCVVRAWWWPCMELQVENTDSCPGTISHLTVGALGVMKGGG